MQLVGQLDITEERPELETESKDRDEFRKGTEKKRDKEGGQEAPLSHSRFGERNNSSGRQKAQLLKSIYPTGSGVASQKKTNREGSGGGFKMHYQNVSTDLPPQVEKKKRTMDGFFDKNEISLEMEQNKLKQEERNLEQVKRGRVELKKIPDKP